MLKIAEKQYIAHPLAEEGEEYGVEYVVLQNHGDGRYIVAARAVGELQNDEWGIYIVEDTRQLFEQPDIAEFFAGLDACETGA